MTRSVEQQHPGEPWLMYWLGNATAIDTAWVRSIAIAWLFKEGGHWCFKPRLCGDTSLFYNAVFFLRLSIPLGIFASVRWRAATGSKALIQASFGWKLIGRLAVGPLFWLAPYLWFYGLHSWGLLALLPAIRVQSDASSAAGATGPNLGQATGFDFGTH